MELQIEEISAQTLPGAIETIRSLPEFFYQRDMQKAEQEYLKAIQSDAEDRIFLVAREEDQVVGVLGAKKRPDANQVYFLASFAVHKQFRRGGIGGQLLTAMEEKLRTKGARLVYAETTTADYCDATRAFYEKMGYQLVATVPDFWTEGDPLALYQKRL